MAKKHGTAMFVFVANRERVRKALADLDEAIRSLEAGATKKPFDWGYAGSMGHLAEVIEDLTSGFGLAVGNGRDERRARDRILTACGGDAEMANDLIAAHAGENPTVADLVAVADHAEEVQADIAADNAAVKEGR